MASPVSPGDVLKLAKGVYRLYKRFKAAPKEMKQLGEQVRLVTALIRQSDNAIMQLDFLKTAEGRNLLDILQSHLREMKKILRRARDVAKQWQKALENFWRRAPFILYTMRAIPGLRADLEFELNLVESVKTQAFQIGVPAALKQLEAKVEAQNRQRKAESQDEFTASERKRRAAVQVLKKSSLAQQPATVAEQRDKTLSTLRKSGLADDEAKKLLDLHELEAKEAAAKSLTNKAAIPVKSKKQEPKKQQNQSNKSSQEGSAKPKVVVVRPKYKAAGNTTEKGASQPEPTAASKDSTGTEEKSKNNQKGSSQNGFKPETRNTKPKDTVKQNDNKKSDGEKNASTTKQTDKSNEGKKTEGEKSAGTGKQPGKGNEGKKASEPKSENKSEQDASTKPKKKKTQTESTATPSESSVKQSKPSDKTKKADNILESANTNTNPPQNKPTKRNDEKKRSNTNLPLPTANEGPAETKKIEKQKGQKETPTNQPKEAKVQKSGDGQPQQAKSETMSGTDSNPVKKAKKKKPETNDTTKEQPLAVAV